MGSRVAGNEEITLCHEKKVHRTEAKRLFHSIMRLSDRILLSTHFPQTSYYKLCWLLQHLTLSCWDGYQCTKESTKWGCELPPLISSQSTDSSNEKLKKASRVLTLLATQVTTMENKSLQKHQYHPHLLQTLCVSHKENCSYAVIFHGLTKFFGEEYPQKMDMTPISRLSNSA